MAIKDDIPDGCTQHPPLSPQPYSDHKFDLPAIECGGATSYVEVRLHELPSGVSTLFSDGYCMAGASAKTSSDATASSNSSSPFSQSKAMCQADSSDSSQTTNICSSSTTDASSSPLQDTALASGVGSGGQCDRDAFMSSEFVLQALEMGFDYEAVRNVVHLKIVQSAENYSTLGDFIEALLAYTVAMTDVSSEDTDETLLQHQQQQQSLQQPLLPQPPQVKPAETTACSSSQQPCHCITSAITSALSASAADTPGVGRRQPRKRKPRRNKIGAATTTSMSTSSCNNGSGSIRFATAATLTDANFANSATKLQTSALAADGGEERLGEPWQLEMENRRLKESKRCKICLEADIAMVFIPCGHLVCCQGCASLVSRCCLCGYRNLHLKVTPKARYDSAEIEVTPKVTSDIRTNAEMETESA